MLGMQEGVSSTLMLSLVAALKPMKQCMPHKFKEFQCSVVLLKHLLCYKLCGV